MTLRLHFTDRTQEQQAQEIRCHEGPAIRLRVRSGGRQRHRRSHTSGGEPSSAPLTRFLAWKMKSAKGSRRRRSDAIQRELRSLRDDVQAPVETRSHDEPSSALLSHRIRYHDEETARGTRMCRRSYHVGIKERFSVCVVLLLRPKVP